jgi:hypothetical protein
MIRNFLFGVLLLYVSGFIVNIFVAHWGWNLSIAAFFITWIAVFLKPGLLKEANDTKTSPDLRASLRNFNRVALPILGLLGIAALIAVFSQPGVCVTDKLPLLAHREHYVLVSHSVYTEVSPLRYFIAGFAFLIGWNVVPLAITLTALEKTFSLKSTSENGD